MHVFKIVYYHDLSSRGPLPGTILAHFGQFWAQKIGAPIYENWVQQLVYFLVTCWTSFGIILWPILGAKISLKRGPKIGPVLESAPCVSQGSGSCQNGK